MPRANLYVDAIAIEPYFPEPDCGRCAVGSCRAFAELLRAARADPEGCPHLDGNERNAFHVAARAAELFPAIEVTQHPQVGEVGLFELNAPGPEAPLLVSGNAEQTVEAVTAILATTIMPLRVLFTDTRGDTVDMALILGSMTPSSILGALEVSAVADRMAARRLMLPGLAAPLATEVAAAGWDVTVGPRCIGEVPLAFAKGWASAG